jgi:hypothetical protein
MSMRLMSAAALVWAVLFAANVHAATTPATLRVDLLHTGNALSEQYALERVVIEPLPWPGNPARPLDDTNRGLNRFEVVDPKTNKVLYSRGYSTIFGEWRTTEEAQNQSRGFQESLRFPMPAAPVRVRVLQRDDRNEFSVVWSMEVDPAALDVQREKRPAPAEPIAIRNNGPSAEKVDLLILGDGYTREQLPKFEADARRLADHLFSVSPFRERASDFNVWALAVPTRESGVSRPSTGTFHDSTLNTRYDIFGSERYVLTLDNRALRELAQYAPNEFIEILVNNETYGGGGIFGQFSTAAASNDWANYLFVHEFGHHFAALVLHLASCIHVGYRTARAVGTECHRAARSFAAEMETPCRPDYAAADAVAQGRIREVPARIPGEACRPAQGEPAGVGNECAVRRGAQVHRFIDGATAQP